MNISELSIKRPVLATVTVLIITPVSYTHLRAHETPEHLVCRLLLEKKNTISNDYTTTL